MATTTSFTVVASTGWQPVTETTTISIDGEGSYDMSEYVIHCGSRGEDLYVFFNASDDLLPVELSGTTLTVTGSVSYLQRIEKDNDSENKYSTVGSTLKVNSSDTTGGFILCQRYIFGSDYASIFGLSMLSGSAYDSSKIAFIAGTADLTISNTYYEQFFNKAFTIMPLPALTSKISPSGNTLYITVSASEYKTTQTLTLSNALPHDFTIGGSTGITVSGFTQTAASGTDNHLIIQLKDYSYDIHGRTRPIIRFVSGTNTVSVIISPQLTGFVEPVNVVEPITYKFLACKAETPGMVPLDSGYYAHISFDTQNKLTIPEVPGDYVLTVPQVEISLFQLNKEAADVPAKDVYYISFATIGSNSILIPLTATLNDTTYDITNNDAVYIVRFKLDGIESGTNFSASAQVVGKLINESITGSFGKVPLELTLLGDSSKYQLPYIAIDDGSIALQTVDHAYALPYDDGCLRSSDLDTAGVSTFPSSVDTQNNVINCNDYFRVEFNRETEGMFKKFAAEDTEEKTNIFATTITNDVINGSLDIYNFIDWPKLGFDLGEGRPIACNVPYGKVNVYNIDEGYVTRDYFVYQPASISDGNMQRVVFNINPNWLQTTAAEAFDIKEQTVFGTLPVNTTDKIMTIGNARYFALSLNNTIYSPSDVSEDKMILDISQYFSQLIKQVNIYELLATEKDTKAITYSAKQVGFITKNGYNIGFSDVYQEDDTLQTNKIFLPDNVFNFDRIGTIYNYAASIEDPPTEITSEANIPDYILKTPDLIREDLQSFDLMWLVKDMTALDIKEFTPSAAHTIESNKDLTITVNNHVDWSATNKLTLKGGKWIVNDLSASAAGSIVVNSPDGSSVVAKGWQNKYLSQLGAPSSIQKNLQTIYDALGNTVQRVPINNTVEYAFNVNGIADSTMKQFENLITSLLQTQVHGGDNRISQYTIEVATPGDDGFGKVAVKFSLPSKDGANTKEIIADVSLNIITNTDASEGTKDNDYYVMYYNATTKAIKFVKSTDTSTALDANVYDGVALKLIKTTSDTEGKLRLFFNNSSVVITTPLFVDDFNEGTPTASFTEQLTTAVNGRIIYKLDSIENLVLVDTVNVANMTID